MAGGIGPIGPLAPLPSPAVGVPSGGGFLGGIGQAAGAFGEGVQQGQQLKIQREELNQRKLQLAMQRLEAYAPIAMRNPDNPTAVKAIQQSFKDAGLDPNLAIKEGKIDTSALIQYSPFFKILTSPSAPFLPPQVLQSYADMAGIKLPEGFGGAIQPKELDAQIREFNTNLRDFGKGHGDKDSLQAQANSLAQDLLASGRKNEATGVLQMAARAGLGIADQTTLAFKNAGIQNLQSLVPLHQAQTQNVNVQTGLNQARIGEVESQTQVNQVRMHTLQQEADASTMRAAAAAKNAETNASRLQVDIGRLSNQTLSTALRSADSYNRGIEDLRKEQTSLQATLQKYSQAGVPKPTDPGYGAYIKANNTLYQITQQLGKLKSVDENQIIIESFKRSGLPNTMKVNNVTHPQGKGDKFAVGQTYTDKNGHRAKYLGNGKWQELP